MRLGWWEVVGWSTRGLLVVMAIAAVVMAMTSPHS